MTRKASVSVPDPVARSPIRPSEPVIISGWEVEGAARSTAALTLADCSALAKTLVRAPANGAMAGALAVTFGRAARDASGALVTGSGPGEWTVIGGLGGALAQRARFEDVAAGLGGGELITVLDLTHGRALIRLTGPASADLLAKVCAIDLAGDRTPSGTALRTSVAKLVTGIVRDDAGDQDAVPSYLLHCERSSGQYLFEVLLDAGTEFGAGVDGFPGPGR
jgi:heterotetrameric sarcosine oxidase gamma subunit